TVASQLMPGGDDAADQRGMAFRDPTQGEEGGADAGSGELRKDAVGIGLHAPRERVPVGPPDAMGEGLDLEVILHIHRHGVADRCAHRDASVVPSRSSTRRNMRSWRAAMCSSDSMRRIRSSCAAAAVSANPGEGAKPAPRSWSSSAAVVSTMAPLSVCASSIEPY